MDLRDVPFRMERIAADIERGSDKLVRDIVEAVVKSVVVVTPVDEGTAKSNWLVGLNSAPADVRKAYSVGKRGSTRDVCENGAFDAARSVMSTYKSGDKVHIVNNLDYIEDLNNGSSRQAPANFVSTATSLAISQVKSSRLLR